MIFSGRTVAITGGASGIGLATAERFVRAGAHVAILDRNERDLGAAAARLNAHGPHAVAIAVDVARSADVQAAFARILAERDGLDVLVNNAGSHAPGRPHGDAGRNRRRDLFSRVSVCELHYRRCAACRRRCDAGVPENHVTLSTLASHVIIVDPAHDNVALAVTDVAPGRYE